MRICQVVPSLEPQHGGPSRSVYGVSAALAQAGHAVDLFATDPNDAGGHQEGNLRVVRFRRGSPQRFCPSPALRRALATNDAAVFHHHGLWLRTLHYTHHAARSRAAFVVSPRGMMSTWAWHHHGGRKRLARTFVHPGAFEAVDGWHATSEAEASEIRALGFRQPVCVAPNGIDEPDTAEASGARTYWHEACPETATRPVALFYSRLHRKKRVLELIDLWGRRGPRDCLLLIVGIPEDYTPAELTWLAVAAGAGDRVRIFDGTNRPAPYAVASLFLLPSHNENFGIVVAEALARGVPALVTDSTPWQELNAQGCGWCVPWERFADAVLTATQETASSLRERGRRGRTWVLSRFSWDNSARLLAEFYCALRR